MKLNLKKIFFTLSIATITAFGFINDSQAEQTRSRSINKRMQHQKSKIREGVASGELTREEAKTLRGQHREIRQNIRDAKSDGKFTKEERREVRQDLREANKNIREMKQNEARRVQPSDPNTTSDAGRSLSPADATPSTDQVVEASE